MAEGNTAPLAEKQIYILGPMSMQNELLAKLLAESTGAKCLTGKSVQEPFSTGAGASLILWDCRDRRGSRSR